MVTDRDIYFFDLHGFLVLEGALPGAEVRALNDGLWSGRPTGCPGTRRPPGRRVAGRPGHAPPA